MAQFPPIPDFQLTLGAEGQPLDRLGERLIAIEIVKVIDGKDAETAIRACVEVMLNVSRTVAGEDMLLQTAMSISNMLIQSALASAADARPAIVD